MLTTTIDLVKATLHDIVQALGSGAVTSTALITRYLDAVDADNVKGLGLHAVIETAPRDLLVEKAKALDEQRKSGHKKSVLHGVPFLIKCIGIRAPLLWNELTGRDCMDVVPELGFQTSAGTFALLEVIPDKNAHLVDRLLDAGAIIFGTTNMTVLSGLGVPGRDGWSPRGGQTVSAFGPGLQVGGSSSGCAVSLSAGLCAFCIGEETNCSLVRSTLPSIGMALPRMFELIGENCPATCAGLYALKPSKGVLSGKGFVPVTFRQDVLGPMGKAPWDLAAVLSVIATNGSGADYLPAIERGERQTIKDFRVGLLRDGNHCTRRMEHTKPALMDECVATYENIIKILQPDIDSVHCPALDALVGFRGGPYGWDEDGKWIGGVLDDLCIFGDVASSFEEYLGSGHQTTLKTVQDLIDWNDTHPDQAFLPEDIDSSERQRSLKVAVDMQHNHRDAYDEAMKQLQAWRAELLEYFEKNNLDLILIMTGPFGADGPPAASATYLPVGSMPVGQLSDKSPLALNLVGKPGGETTILAYMAAVQGLLPDRPLPEALLSDDKENQTR